MSEKIALLTNTFPLEFFPKWPDFFPNLMKSTTSLLDAIASTNGSLEDRDNLLIAFDSILSTWVLFGILSIFLQLSFFVVYFFLHSENLLCSGKSK
jgi:hypothetical protein